MSIRIDKVTGKAYTWYNIPIIDGSLTCIQNSKGLFMIMAENHSHPEDSWYEGRFIGDRYAVFRRSNGFFQQVSPWYERFGNAVRKLKNITEVE